jgi:hypothetical protein
MSIRSHTRMKLHVRNCDASSSFPHVFSGNPGGIRTGPPIKAFGGDGFKAVFTSGSHAAPFQLRHEAHKGSRRP